MAAAGQQTLLLVFDALGITAASPPLSRQQCLDAVAALEGVHIVYCYNQRTDETKRLKAGTVKKLNDDQTPYVILVSADTDLPGCQPTRTSGDFDFPHEACSYFGIWTARSYKETVLPKAKQARERKERERAEAVAEAPKRKRLDPTQELEDVMDVFDDASDVSPSANNVDFDRLVYAEDPSKWALFRDAMDIHKASVTVKDRYSTCGRSADEKSAVSTLVKIVETLMRVSGDVPEITQHAQFQRAVKLALGELEAFRQRAQGTSIAAANIYRQRTSGDGLPGWKQEAARETVEAMRMLTYKGAMFGEGSEKDAKNTSNRKRPRGKKDKAAPSN